MELGHNWPAVVNAFIEDTCVIFAAAYLLTRGRTIQSLGAKGNWTTSAWFGLVFGLLAASEVVFPNMRAPYVSHMLVVSLAAVLGGWRVVVPAIAVVITAAAVIDGAAEASWTAACLVVVAAVSLALRRLTTGARKPLTVAGIVTFAQADAVLGNVLWSLLRHDNVRRLSAESIPANAFGAFLIMLVVQDSESRLNNEQHRLDLERFKVLLVSADLAALRARIRPHFLFNTLTAIASLCAINPKQAEASIVKLGRLMRRTLDVETTSLSTLEAELDYVRAYVDIQSLRFNGVISTRFDFEPEVMNAEVPAFGLQTCVENAYQHGFATRSGPGSLLIAGRARRNHWLLFVRDDGAGMGAEERRAAIAPEEAPQHGLGIIDRQLRHLYGTEARLRLFSTPGKGTLVAFRVPRYRVNEVRQAL